MLVLNFNSPNTSNPACGNDSLGVPFPLSSNDHSSLASKLKENWRKPYALFPEGYHKQFNYSFTINPDPRCKWIKDNDCRDRKSHHARLREFISDAHAKKLFSAVIVIYEYGKYGKKFGKLHYHLLFRTAKAKMLQDNALTYFTDNKANNHAVVKKRITHSLKKLEASPIMMKTSLNQNKRYIFETYFRKEQPCKTKCLVHL